MHGQTNIKNKHLYLKILQRNHMKLLTKYSQEK